MSAIFASKIRNLINALSKIKLRFLSLYNFRHIPYYKGYMPEENLFLHILLRWEMHRKYKDPVPACQLNAGTNIRTGSLSLNQLLFIIISQY